MSCCTKTYNLGCFNNCSIIAVGLCETSGTYNGVFTYGNISTTITVTAIENEPFLFDLSLLNENATYNVTLYNNSGNKITQTIDNITYDCFSVKTLIYGGVSDSGTVVNASDVYSITIIGNDSASYQNDSLIGATILFVTTDSAVRIPTDYSLNSTTGTLTFISQIDTDTVIQIIYK